MAEQSSNRDDSTARDSRRSVAIDICGASTTALERWLYPLGWLLLPAIIVVLLFDMPLYRHSARPATVPEPVAARQTYSPQPATPAPAQPVATEAPPPEAAVPTPEPETPDTQPATADTVETAEPSLVAARDEEATAHIAPSTESGAATVEGTIRVEQDDEGITLIIEEVLPQTSVEKLSPEGEENETPPMAAVQPAHAEKTKEQQATATSKETSDGPDTANADKRSEAETSATALPPAPRYQEQVYIHTVVKGDTLWDIATRYLDDPWRFPELAKRSGIDDPDRIYPGNRVRIIIRRRTVNGGNGN